MLQYLHNVGVEKIIQLYMQKTKIRNIFQGVEA